MSSNVRLVSLDGVFKFVDNDEGILKTRKVNRLLERYQSFFQDIDQLVLSSELNYVQLADLIGKLNDRLNGSLEVGQEIRAFIEQNHYAINEQRVAGVTIKEYDDRWNDELQQFKEVIDQEISRPLKPQQVQASFYLATMKRAANFSVPGAGKTAMTYGAFAYLSSSALDEVNKLLVIAPLNAFEAWRTEFIEVFGDKRQLSFMNLKDFDNPADIRTNWGIANVIVINHESLFGWKLSVLNASIDEKTMLNYLKNVDLNYDEATNQVVIPSWRQDIHEMNDVAEEVARFYGYDKIPTTLPCGSATPGKTSKMRQLQIIAGQAARSNGFSQGMNYSFESPKVFDKL